MKSKVNNETTMGSPSKHNMRSFYKTPKKQNDSGIDFNSPDNVEDFKMSRAKNQNNAELELIMVDVFR